MRRERRKEEGIKEEGPPPSLRKFLDPPLTAV